MRRSFPPGSEWLYAKLYTGTATADGLLREVVAPVARESLAAGEADGWFFIRYGDPEWHLRLRFHGDPGRLQAAVLPRLHAAFDPLLADGRIWRVQLDTYEREIERYGGPQGMPLSERLFQVDSEAVLEILGMLEGDEGADLRWRLALRGIDMLLGDLRFDPETRLGVMRNMRESFSQEFGGGKGLRVQLDQRFRQEWRSLMPLLDPAGDADSELAPALAVLRRRSERLRPIVDELRQLERAGRLQPTIAALAPSYVHMHVNRIIRSAQRAHEMVLYDFLYLLYESRAARERKGGAERPPKPAKPPKIPNLPRRRRADLGGAGRRERREHRVEPEMHRRLQRHHRHRPRRHARRRRRPGTRSPPSRRRSAGRSPRPRSCGVRREGGLAAQVPARRRLPDLGAVRAGPGEVDHLVEELPSRPAGPRDPQHPEVVVGAARAGRDRSPGSRARRS